MRYSWRGPNHKQSRLDYFMITSDIDAFVISLDIGISYRSDYSPVLINLIFSSQIRRKVAWKFNNCLLGETWFVEKVKGTLKLSLTNRVQFESDPSIDSKTDDNNFDISYQLYGIWSRWNSMDLQSHFSSFLEEGRK